MYHYIYTLLIVFSIGFLYDRYKIKLDNQEQRENTQIIEKYLLENQILENEKPILWIHFDYHINSRNWLNFMSRNSEELNQPYKLLTVQSIIKHSNDDFNICLIDDNSFHKLIPGWSIDLNKLSEPIKNHIRSLGVMKLLYYYGGFHIPSSYLALDNINKLYKEGLQKKDCFILEGLNNNSTSKYTSFFPTHRFIGCRKHSIVMKEIIQYLEKLNSIDYTTEQDFLGQTDRFCYKLIQENKMVCINGEKIGVKDKKRKPVLIDDLIQTSYISFDDSLQGILIPDKDILKRTKYQWFARLSVEQIYKSNIILSKYMILANK